MVMLLKKLLILHICMWFFIILLLGGIIIPIWIITSGLGIMEIIYELLKYKRVNKQTLFFTFSIILIPYYETKRVYNAMENR
jgi:hypothetical protein